MIKVLLPGVTVTDNVGVYSFATSRPNGSEFTWGEHNVTYTASDIAKNIAQCNFQVIITGKYIRLFKGKLCLEEIKGGVINLQLRTNVLAYEKFLIKNTLTFESVIGLLLAVIPYSGNS